MPKPLTEAEQQIVDRLLQIDDFDAALNATPTEILNRVTGIGTGDPDADDIHDFFDGKFFPA